MLATAALPLWALLALALIALVAGFLHAATGFGFALVAVSLGSLIATPHDVVIQTFLTSGVISLALTQRGLRDVVWRDALGLTLTASLLMPLGVVVLTHTSATALRVLLGSSTLVALAWLIRSERTISDHWAASWWSMGLAGGISGVLNTSIATNGPPLVIYLRGRGLTPEAFRATISFVFTASNVVGLAVLIAGGAVNRGGVVLSLWTALPTLLGFVAGYRVTKRINPETFRRLVNGLLAVSAVIVLAKGAGLI